MGIKNPFFAVASDNQLRCLAFGHAWERPEDWRRWVADKADNPLVYTIRTKRECSHSCGAEQRTIMHVRTSVLGTIVEVIRTRHRIRWGYAERSRRYSREHGYPVPARKEFRLELIRRQLGRAVAATGTKMRRRDASANIVVLTRQQ